MDDKIDHKYFLKIKMIEWDPYIEIYFGITFHFFAKSFTAWYKISSWFFLNIIKNNYRIDLKRLQLKIIVIGRISLILFKLVLKTMMKSSRSSIEIIISNIKLSHFHQFIINNNHFIDTLNIYISIFIEIDIISIDNQVISKIIWINRLICLLYKIQIHLKIIKIQMK